MIKIIAIAGRKGSGKDTTADYLIANYGFQRYAFADPLKEGLKHMFDFTDEQLWGTQEQKEAIDPRWGTSPRKLLQIIGTELLQFDVHKYMDEGEFNVGRAIWVYRFKIWYDKQLLINPDLKVVFSDVRFQHEVDAINEIGGEVWKIIRPNIDSVSTHASEAELDNVVANKTIMNDGSLEDLYKNIENNLVVSENGSMFAKTN
jgi:hypothetical protein